LRTVASGDDAGVSEERENEPQAEEARKKAGERSTRPDIQAGALEMAEGDEPREREHPSYRETADEREQR
jgi:hypothetical protein